MGREPSFCTTRDPALFLPPTPAITARPTPALENLPPHSRRIQRPNRQTPSFRKFGSQRLLTPHFERRTQTTASEVQKGTQRSWKPLHLAPEHAQRLRRRGRGILRPSLRPFSSLSAPFPPSPSPHARPRRGGGTAPSGYQAAYRCGVFLAKPESVKRLFAARHRAPDRLDGRGWTDLKKCLDF